LGKKQYKAVAVVCRVWLRKVLFLIPFARLSWEGLITETNWGRKRTGSIRASSTVSFKLVVGLDRLKKKKNNQQPPRKRHGVRFQMLWCRARSAAIADVKEFRYDLSKEHVDLVVLLPELPN